VGKLLEENGAKMVGFSRIEVGEGIEKKKDDFAAEVAAMAGGNKAAAEPAPAAEPLAAAEPVAAAKPAALEPVAPSDELFEFYSLYDILFPQYGTTINDLEELTPEQQADVDSINKIYQQLSPEERAEADVFIKARREEEFERAKKRLTKNWAWGVFQEAMDAGYKAAGATDEQIRKLSDFDEIMAQFDTEDGEPKPLDCPEMDEEVFKAKLDELVKNDPNFSDVDVMDVLYGGPRVSVFPAMEKRMAREQAKASTP
jgi:hypothetical protein